ncbi:MAG: hypothetical protein AB7F86_09205 [Bdellovibrionales bacterium]
MHRNDKIVATEVGNPHDLYRLFALPITWLFLVGCTGVAQGSKAGAPVDSSSTITPAPTPVPAPAAPPAPSPAPTPNPMPAPTPTPLPAPTPMPSPGPGVSDFPKDGFCNDSGVSWAFCEDFDGQGSGGKASVNFANSGIHYHSHSGFTFLNTTCDSTKNEGSNCEPYALNGSLFLNAEDGGFGLNVLRVERPFDITNREGRIHFRTQLKGHGRMKQTVHFTPTANNTLPDLRFPEFSIDLAPALTIQFQGDGGWPFEILTFKNGAVNKMEHVDGPFEYIGFKDFNPENQYDIDIYVSRTRVRILMNGIQIFNQPFNIEFNVGYVYFAQLAYNPVKDNSPERNTVGEAGNRFLWDNFAFDGPVWPKNGLTPENKKVILFRAYEKASCTVKGIPAEIPFALQGYDTWRVELDRSLPIGIADIRCSSRVDYGLPQGESVDIGDIEVIERK